MKKVNPKCCQNKNLSGCEKYLIFLIFRHFPLKDDVTIIWHLTWHVTWSVTSHLKWHWTSTSDMPSVLQNFQNFLSAGISMENFLSNFCWKIRPYPPIKCKTHQIWSTYSWKSCFLQKKKYFWPRNNLCLIRRISKGNYSWKFSLNTMSNQTNERKYWENLPRHTLPFPIKFSFQ